MWLFTLLNYHKHDCNGVIATSIFRHSGMIHGFLSLAQATKVRKMQASCSLRMDTPERSRTTDARLFFVLGYTIS